MTRPPDAASRREFRDLTFVDLGDGMVEVRREGSAWNGRPGVYDRFALYTGDTFEAGVADYVADEFGVEA